MIGRMPALFARPTASLASSRGGSIMPTSPANTRSCSTRSSISSSATAPAGNDSIGDAERAQRAAGELFVRQQDLRPRRFAQRAWSFADELLRARVSSTSGRAFREDEHALPRSRRRCAPCSSTCVPRRTGLRRRGRNLAVQRSALQPGLSRRHDERAFCRVTLYGPPAVMLLQHGVVRAVGDSERAIQFDPETAFDGLPVTLTSPSGA